MTRLPRVTRHAFGAPAVKIDCDQRYRTDMITNDTIPDFGPLADAAVKAAVDRINITVGRSFGLRNHEGTFRVSERASYVSRGVVVLYTQRLRPQFNEACHMHFGSFTCPCVAMKNEPVWDDFAKGTEEELLAQIVRR